MDFAGHDGFRLSDTRAAPRRHFHVDAPSIVLQVVQELAAGGALDAEALRKAHAAYDDGRVQREAQHLGHVHGPAHRQEPDAVRVQVVTWPPTLLFVSNAGSRCPGLAGSSVTAEKSAPRRTSRWCG